MSEDSETEETHDAEDGGHDTIEAEHNAEGRDEDEEEEDEEEEYEYEYDITREEAGTVVSQLGEGVSAGSVKLGGDDGVRVDVPDRVELEIEYEVDDERELEVEIEWDDESSADDEGSEAEAEEGDEDTDTGETDGEDTDVGEVEAAAEEAGDAAEESEADDESQPDPSEVVTPVESESGGSGARFELYRDRADEWRWRLVHRNGNVIADSGEGYARRAGARNGLESVMKNAPGATVVEKD